MGWRVSHLIQPVNNRRKIDTSLQEAIYSVGVNEWTNTKITFYPDFLNPSKHGGNTLHVPKLLNTSVPHNLLRFPTDSKKNSPSKRSASR